MADLYGITGFYKDGAVTLNRFAGSFTRLDGGRIVGNLVDPYGGAEIKGWLRSDSLIFDKTYDGRQFAYQFTRGQNEVWVGDYRGVTSPMRGDAVCKIRVDWKNIQNIDPGAAIQQLIESAALISS